MQKKKVEFIKMHGQGNDFVMIDAFTRQISFSPDEIALICDRHFGVGADGLIMVKKSQSADFFMDYYNSDGTTAEMCGNGIRCMAGFIADKKLSTKENLKIDTRAGIKEVFITSKKSKPRNIRVNMGKPVFEPSSIPVNIKDAVDKNIIHNYPLKTNEGLFYINCVSMGNPHCVIFLESDIDLKSIPLEKWGRIIENNPIFPKKTNVEFVILNDKNSISMRVWERGVGETLACGTGACAASVCSLKFKKLQIKKLKVYIPGGELEIYWEKDDADVLLEGKIETVFEGFFYI